MSGNCTKGMGYQDDRHGISVSMSQSMSETVSAATGCSSWMRNPLFSVSCGTHNTDASSTSERGCSSLFMGCIQLLFASGRFVPLVDRTGRVQVDERELLWPLLECSSNVSSEHKVSIGKDDGLAVMGSEWRSGILCVGLSMLFEREDA